MWVRRTRFPANAAPRGNVRAGTPAHPGSPRLRRDGAGRYFPAAQSGNTPSSTPNAMFTAV